MATEMEVWQAEAPRQRKDTGGKTAGATWERSYTWKELPQPQVLFTCGLLNLNP